MVSDRYQEGEGAQGLTTKHLPRAFVITPPNQLNFLSITQDKPSGLLVVLGYVYVHNRQCTREFSIACEPFYSNIGIGFLIAPPFPCMPPSVCQSAPGSPQPAVRFPPLVLLQSSYNCCRGIFRAFANHLAICQRG